MNSLCFKQKLGKPTLGKCQTRAQTHTVKMNTVIAMQEHITCTKQSWLPTPTQ